VERQTADAALGCGDERFAERRFVETGRDAKAAAFLAELARCDGVERDEEIVEPPAAREAGVVGRVDQVARRAQSILGVFERQDLRKALGTDSGPAGKQPLEVKRAHAYVPRDLVERWSDGRGFVEKTDRSFDPMVVSAVAVGHCSHVRSLHG
jgi:hypothetical protein